jgi:hypothetical protein
MTIISTPADLDFLRALMGCPPIPDPAPVEDDPLAIVFLIAGGNAGKTGKIYAAAKTAATSDPRRHAVLITDLSLLGAERATAWFDNSLDRYAIFRRDPRGFTRTAQTLDPLWIGAVNRANSFKIRGAFSTTAITLEGCAE